MTRDQQIFVDGLKAQGAISTCPAGEERYKSFRSRSNKRRYIQYEYRHSDGTLFTKIGKTVEECRSARDIWLLGIETRNRCVL